MKVSGKFYECLTLIRLFVIFFQMLLILFVLAKQCIMVVGRLCLKIQQINIVGMGQLVPTAAMTLALSWARSS